MKLGAIHRPQPLAVRPLSKRASLHLMNPPASADWHKYCPPDGDPLANDTYGCCVEVADYRVIQMRRAVLWGDKTKPLVSDILGRYSKITGFNLATKQPDAGTDTVADLTDWMKNGIVVGMQALDAPLWAMANPADLAEVNIAIAHTGPLLVTMGLPLAAQDLSAWSKAPGEGKEWDVWGWGGHRVMCGKYDGDVRTIRTWGQDVALHPEWWSRYVVGVDVLLSRFWMRSVGTAPSGLDWDALKSDMAFL